MIPIKLKSFKAIFVFMKLFWLVICLSDVSLGVTNNYCNITPNHTLCLHQDGVTSEACGRIHTQGVADDQEREIILQLHNQLRARIANGLETRGNPGPQPSAANMMELTWDSELERGAQAWTNRCIVGHDCPDCRRLERFAVGQNLYEFGHFSGNWERSVQGWFDEVEDFNNTFVDPFFIPKGLLVGHFTQLIWAQTYKIGCGKLFFYPPEEEKFGKQLYVCNYGLAGNLIGSQLYQVGPPCSDCPLGTSCSAKFPGLCAGEPEAPLTIRPPKFDFNPPDVAFTQRPANSGSTGNVRPLDKVEIQVPAVLGNDNDTCVYTCKENGGCSVAFRSDRPVSGASLGSCFPPSFGGDCSGIPSACQPCLDPCKSNPGKVMTVFVNKTADATIIEDLPKVEQSPINGMGPGGSPDATCFYNCQATGGCSVRIQSSEPINGNTLGSCFSQDFGGSCSGIPDRCEKCLGPCENKPGEMFSLPASNNL